MRRRWDALVLAMAYFAAAKLGLMLAIPPGYATAVWPAAGLALAGLLLRPAAWPGVAMGSFLANLPAAAAGEQASLLRSTVVALSIGLGAAAQAAAGSALVRRFVGFPSPLASPRDVGLFYLLGGPVACLVSSTWGVSTLVASGAVAGDEVALNWWTWWVGDVIGCLATAPLILVWSHRPSAGALRRPIAVCVPLAMVFASVVVLFLYTSAWESDRLRSDFERRAEAVAARVSSRIGVNLEVLRSVANLYSSTSVMNGRAFRDFVEHPLARYAEMQALSWNVSVADSRREEFESSIRHEGYAGFAITERGPGGLIVPAQRRREYVPVTYIEPRAPNAAALGFDVLSDHARRATLERARRSGAPAATSRIGLVQGSGGQFGFLVFMPARRAEPSVDPHRPEAYAVGAFRAGQMLESIMKGVDTEGIDIEVRDEDAAPAEQLVYQNGLAAGTAAVFERKMQIPVADHRWAIGFRLMPSYLAAHKPWQAWSVLAAGLLFAGLLGAFLLVVTGRTIEIEQLVHQRTAELAAEVRERGRAQRELERVMSSVSDALWAAEVTSSGTFEYSYLSPNIERITGRPASFFLESPERWMSIVDDEDRPRVRAITERLVSGASERADAEYRLVTVNGGIRWVRDSLTASRAPNGSVQLSGVISDITGAKEAERLSRERETQAAEAKRDERFRSLIENATDVVLVVDPSSTVLYASPSVEPILGEQAGGMVGSRLLDRVAFEDRGGLQRGFAGVAERPGSTESLNFRIHHKDGSVRVMEGTARNLSNRPEVGGTVINCRDVTERSNLEEQLRQALKMDAIGRLAGGVAHDFNNILGVITGYGELLARDLGANHSASHRLSQIRRAADRAAGLTRQLLAFSRKQLQRLEVLEINALVSDVGKMLRRLIGEDIQLVTVLGAHVGRVRADAGQLEQVVMNLAINARDAMPGGGKLVIETTELQLDDAFVHTHTGAASGRHVVLSVTDTGRGMDPATLSRVFEPFFTTKGEGKGTGLGLATVYGIVRQSHGYVDVTSALGRGTTFRVYLPSVAEDRATAADVERAPAAAPPMGSETVLLVEDDEALRRLLQEILADGGYDVVEATPEQAVEVARSRHVDLLLTDVIMPGMSGPEVAEAVRSSQPSVRVVFMSGYTDDALGRHRVLDAGTHLLEKPFSADSVLRKLREILDD